MIIALKLLASYWREAVIGLLCVALMGFCVERDHRIAREAVAKEKVHVADSTLKVVIPEWQHADTLVVHDTVKVRVAVDRVTTLTDTVLHHLTDTLLIKEYVTRADSAAKACSELSGDCAEFRRTATLTIAALRDKANAATSIPARSCVAPSVITGLLAGAAVFVLRR